MRALIIVFFVVLGVIFLGGAFNIGGAPIFGHVDAVLDTNLFMQIHYTFFSLIYRGERSLDSGVMRTQDDLEEFSKRPIGIDNPETYRNLDNASDY
jgi:hypothetical protein